MLPKQWENESPVGSIRPSPTRPLQLLPHSFSVLLGCTKFYTIKMIKSLFI